MADELMITDHQFQIQSWEIESPNPEIICMIEPTMTSCIPLFKIPWMEFFISKLIENTAAIATTKTPLYTSVGQTRKIQVNFEYD